jgi:hypothetical protein
MKMEWRNELDGNGMDRLSWDLGLTARMGEFEGGEEAGRIRMNG